MEKKVFALVLMIACAMLLFGCTTPPDQNTLKDQNTQGVHISPDQNTFVDKNIQILPALSLKKLDDTQATIEGVNSVVNANNQFGLDVFNKVDEAGKNVFVSPISLETALAMTLEGASGTTALEMRTTLHLPADDVQRQASFARIYNILNTPNQDYTLGAANALWAEQTYKFDQNYFNTISNYYYGKVTNMDFVGKAEASRLTINNWVETQTNNRIKNLIPQGVIDQYTRLVLTNAIYFKGQWDTNFNKENTHELGFKVNNNKITQVNMMNNDFTINYSEDNYFQAIELPYKGNNLSMVVILPQNESDYSTPTLNEINSLTSDFNKYETEVYLPQFKFETKYLLADKLVELGMPTAFSDSATFTKMDPENGVKISEVIHQTFVEVNETGTEAAAATAVIMEATSAYPGPQQKKVFYADHPFYFIIKDNQTGTFLFFGKVSDPTAAS